MAVEPQVDRVVLVPAAQRRARVFDAADGLLLVAESVARSQASISIRIRRVTR